MEPEGQWWKSQLAADIHQALRIKVSCKRFFAFLSPNVSIQASVIRCYRFGFTCLASMVECEISHGPYKTSPDVGFMKVPVLTYALFTTPILHGFLISYQISSVFDVIVNMRLGNG